MDINYYVNKMVQTGSNKRVQRSSFTTTNYYKNGKLIAVVNGSGDIEFPDLALLPTQDTAIINKDFLNSYTKVKEEFFDEQAFLTARKTTQEQRETIIQEFKNDLFVYLDIQQHPKAEKLWELAVEESTIGFQGIFDEAERLVVLLK